MSSNKLSMRVVFLSLVIRLMSVTANGLDLEQCDTPEQCLLWSASSNSQLQRKDTQPCVSKPAPFWQGSAVVDGKVEDIKLTDYRGKYLVFFFYPLDFTFVCPTEVLAFNDNIDAFRKIGTEVLGVSVDSHFSHLAWINSLKRDGRLVDMRIPLLSDLTHQISQSYGVYLHDKGHSLRGLFIIDREGILRQITLNDLEVGRSVEETLRLVQAFQHHDASGELCPSGWKPGDPAIEIPKSEKENINSESVDTMAV